MLIEGDTIWHRNQFSDLFINLFAELDIRGMVF